MPAFRVTWSQPATVAATVTVDLEDLAAWAVAADVVRGLTTPEGTAARVADLTVSLERNPHLRDALLRMWAAQHMPQ